MTKTPDDRSPLALALEWTSRITTISVEMVLPGLCGFWVDRQLGTKMVFLLVGIAAGFSLGMWQLIGLAASSRGGDGPSGKPKDGPQPRQ